MSALRTALVGALTALVGVWIAVAVTAHIALPGVPGYESLQTVAHTPPTLLIIVGLTLIAQWVVGGPKLPDNDGSEGGEA